MNKNGEAILSEHIRENCFKQIICKYEKKKSISIDEYYYFVIVQYHAKSLKIIHSFRIYSMITSGLLSYFSTN